MRLLDSLERPPVVQVEAPLRVLVMISSPSDMPELAVERERQLLVATTGDLVASGRLDGHGPRGRDPDGAAARPARRLPRLPLHRPRRLRPAGAGGRARARARRRHGAPRLGRPPRHPAPRRPLHAARRPQRLRGSADLRTRRVLRRRPGARAPGPAGGGRDADGDLRPGGARLQPRVLLLPDPRTRDRRRHLRGAQVDGGVRRGVGVGHRGAAPVGRRPAVLVHDERHRSRSSVPRAGSSPSTTPRTGR